MLPGEVEARPQQPPVLLTREVGTGEHTAADDSALGGSAHIVLLEVPVVAVAHIEDDHKRNEQTGARKGVGVIVEAPAARACQRGGGDVSGDDNIDEWRP